MNDWLSALITKRKIFISFHHDNDQAYFDFLSKLLLANFELIEDHSLGNDLINSDNFEYVRRAIKEQKIKGTSATIVLCGAESHKRKFIDHEIHSTLHLEHAILGIVLPTAQKNINGDIIAPERLIHNVNTGYGHWIYWTADAIELKKQIEIAIAKSQNKRLINNSMPKVLRNKQ